MGAKSKISLPVAIDAMGGDHGSSVVVQGAVDAWINFRIATILVGCEDEIRKYLSAADPKGEARIEILNAPEVVGMEESPSIALRKKPRSSMRLAFKLVADGQACGVLGPGNTGAMMATGLHEFGVFEGLNRPAIASLIPNQIRNTPSLLLDSGANTECHARQLVQFALMGSIYCREVQKQPNPRVGLLSNGTEDSKGTDVTRAAAYILRSMRNINYIGYVEGGDLAQDIVDVVVCDGFVGNVLLKGMEGAVKLVSSAIKQASENSLKAKLGLWLARSSMKQIFLQKLDPSAYGGAPLLGLREIAVVTHGSSNARAIMNATRVTKELVSCEVTTVLERALGSLEAIVSA